MGTQQLLAIILLLISFVGIGSSLSLELIVTNNAGPGLFPLVYSVLLAVCSVILYFQGRKGEPVRLKALFQKPLADAVFFYLMLLVCFLLADILRLPVALGVFSVAVLVQQRKLPRWQIVIFEVLFLAVYYLLFEVFLKVPFEHGILFR